MILTTAAQMRELDRRTIEELGLPGLVLMENAARGVVQVINRLFPEVRSVAVLAGKGNNGGDGLAVARYLHHQGLAVAVYLAGAAGALQGDAARNLNLAERCGVPVLEIPPEGDEVRESRQLFQDLHLVKIITAQIAEIQVEIGPLFFYHGQGLPEGMAVAVDVGKHADLHGREVQ